MKKLIINGIIILAVALLPPQVIQAQGTMVYVSNLAQLQAGSLAAGSDSWVGNEFSIGSNPGGYVLDSVQLAMANASGNPGGFTVLLYGTRAGGEAYYGSGGSDTVTPLIGSNNPSTAGIYTYAPPASLMLSQNYFYSIVINASTTVATGSYNWIEADGPLNLSGGWSSSHALACSSDGLSWSNSFGSSGVYPEFAVNATAVPEPGVLGLFSVGILILCGWRKPPNS
jgi:hypothetical protein